MNRIYAAIVIASTVLFCAVVSAYQVPPLNEEARLYADDMATDIDSTFDPNGAFDNDGLVKDPVAGGESAPTEPPAEEDWGDPRGGAAPANDACGNAIIVPGNAVTYNAPLVNTTGATTGSCEALETCEAGGAGTSNSVWYSYTPDKSGTVTINTFGSNYNTVLSVFTGTCGIFVVGGGCFNIPTQIVCNDDYPFGTTSQVSLSVTGGQTYKIKVADFNTTDGGGVLDFNLFWAPANDNCAAATVISSKNYDPPTYSTVNAATDTCDNEETCEVNNVGTSNSVWYSYTPPCNGFLNINTNGSSYDTVLSVWSDCGEFFAVDFPCNFPNPAPVELACDDDSGTGTQSQLTDVAVTEGVTYVIKVSDYNTTSGGGTLNFNSMFVAADAPTAAITTPAALSCVCDIAGVQGTANAGAGPVTWQLESQAVGGTGWTLISSGIVPITNASLGIWNTTALSQGYYNLRLSVQNSCGLADTAVQTVFVDKQFDTLDLREPDELDLVAGNTCVDGTVWDQCINNYTVMYRAQGGGAFAPVDSGNPVYSVGVVNDPLAGNGWDTTTLPDGDYQLRIEAIDGCGHPASVIRNLSIDNTPPTALISNPASCTSVDGNVSVMGTANDAHLAGWTLQYTGGNSHTWVTIASGGDPVVNGLLGTWNTAGLPACAYTLRLIATDEAVQSCGPLRSQTEYTVSVSIGTQAGLCCDVNQDGFGDALGVQPFVECLIDGTCP